MRKIVLLSFVLLVLVAAVSVSTASAASAWYVSPTGDNGNDCLSPATACATIQAAIDKASADDTVNVAAGTYTETLSVTKSLHLVGAGSGASIIAAAATLPPSSSVDSAIVSVVGAGVDAELTGFTVSGPGPSACGSIKAAIFVRGGANADIHDDIIADARDNASPVSGCQNGIGILVGRNADATIGTATIANNQIVTYQKGGIVVDAAGSNATITGNTITGIGTTTITAQNGIQISRGATAILSGNTVTGNSFHIDGNTWDWGATGILLYQSGAVDLTGGNNISGNDSNLYIQATTGPVTVGAEAFGASTAPLEWGYYVVNYNSYALDLSQATFEGVAPATASAAEVLSIKERVWDGIDQSGLGVCTLKAGNQYVTSTGSIQRAIDAAASGDTVNIGAATFTENVRVNKSVTLAGSGSGAGGTTVIPAVSLPNPCAGSSLCGGPTAASNVFLVEANDVTIHDLAVDGDNPGLTSTIVRGTADLDARNGIIKNTDANYSNLEVYNTAVRNIYLRGVYSTGGSFNFHDNSVTNVQGDSGSIAMFAWGGPGTMAHNTVSFANDAISANHSNGIQFLNNTVTDSLSGVHTDNSGDAGGVADLIQDNNITCSDPVNAYGIFVFVPYIAPTVNHNTVTGCAVGLSARGGNFPPAATVTTPFTNNTVNGPSGAAGSVGAYITTDTIGWGYTDVAVDFSGNIITGNETGVYLTADQQTWNPGAYAAKTITADFTRNEIAGNTNGMEKGTGGTVDATAILNWWGAASGPYNAGSNASGTGNSIADGIPFTPWLGSALPAVEYVGPTGTINIGNPVVTATAYPEANPVVSADLWLDRAGEWGEDDMYNFPCTVVGGAVSCPTAGLPVGAYLATVTVTDSVGDTGTATGEFTIVDNTPPVTSDNAPSTWQNTDVTVTLSCVDDISGCASTTWSSDNGGPSGSGGFVTISNEGTTTITYHSTDVSGNVESDKTAEVRIDKTAPATTDNAPAEWQTADFTVTLSCSDALSGCASTTYTVDGGSPQTGGSVAITTDGDHTIVYSSTDLAGNAEGTHTVHAMLDKTAPSTTDNAPAAWQNADFTVTLSCSDADSGCDTTRYTVDGGSEQTGNSVTIDTEGDHEIVYYSTDVAGNEEGSHTVHAKLDKTDPATTDNAPSGWQNADFTVTLSCGDALSGCASTTYTVDGGSPQTGGSVAITTNGDHTIVYSSTDLAGNTEDSHTVHAMLDKVAPAVAITSPATVYVTQITGTTSDAAPSSAMLTATMSLDSGTATPCDITGGNIDCAIDPSVANGSHSVVISVTDGAGNTGTASGSFTYAAHGKPDLGITVTRIYWASYADYTERKLSVDYRMTNESAGITAAGVQIEGVIINNGVTLATDMPLVIGDMPAATNASFSLQYEVPSGVTQFKTRLFASASDPVGDEFFYPTPMP